MLAQNWIVLALIFSTLEGAGMPWLPAIQAPVVPAKTIRAKGIFVPNQFPPNPENDFASTPEDIPKLIDVLKNDSDPDGDLDPRSVTISGAPRHGSTHVNPATGVVTYSPDLNYNGMDQYVYHVCDMTSLCDWAIVDVLITPVNDPPVASDDYASTPEDIPVLVDVVANDYDVDGNLDPGSVKVLPGQAPEHGNASVNPATGGITYAPDQDFYGGDGFKYQVCDLVGGQTTGDCDTASVTLSISPVNDAPNAIPNSYQVIRNTVLKVAAPGVLVDDQDVEGDALTAILDSGPSTGALTLDLDGSFTYLTEPHYTGMVSFAYRAKDHSASSNATTVQIEVLDSGNKTISVNWDSPVGDLEVLQVKNEIVILQARVANCGSGCQVRFYRWDSARLRYIHLGLDPSQPYQYQLDTSGLTPGWNQVFIVAFNSAGQVSAETYIWLYRLSTTYFPIVHR